MTPADIAAVAAGLTKAMREVLVGPVYRRLYGVLVVQSGASNTLKALEKRGLLNGIALEDAGLAVRALLIEQEKSA